MLKRSPLGFGLLFLVSAPAWWLFKLFNRRTQNWFYQGAEFFTDIQYFLLSSLSFSTVMPAVFGSAELICTFRWMRRFDHGPDAVMRTKPSMPARRSGGYSRTPWWRRCGPRPLISAPDTRRARGILPRNDRGPCRGYSRGFRCAAKRPVQRSGFFPVFFAAQRTTARARGRGPRTLPRNHRAVRVFPEEHCDFARCRYGRRRAARRSETNRAVCRARAATGACSSAITAFRTSPSSVERPPVRGSACEPRRGDR
jgi:hypothetical protein